jgi:hypothetical protein
MSMLATPTAPAKTVPAHSLCPEQRQQLAVDVLSGSCIADLARQHHVSRKFVYQQADKALCALQQAFTATPPPEEVLFYLPVTKAWIRQLVVALVLICHSSLRGVVELLADLFDYHISIGTVHNILQHAVATAEPLNQEQDLAAIRIGAYDELFQASDPVLVGVDAHSTYCYLLSPEEHRDGDTWGVRLLELVERGFDPEATIADFGTGLRKGQKLALPNTPCRGDIFHPVRDFQTLVTYLEARAYEAIAHLEDLRKKQTRFEKRKGRKDRKLVNPTTAASSAAEQAIALADDVGTLLQWLRQDILAVAGPPHATRRMLYDWVVDELRSRENLCPRIGSIRQQLENHRDDLLAFAEELDEEVRSLADHLQVPLGLVRAALTLQQLDGSSLARQPVEESLRRQLGGKYTLLQAAVAEVDFQVVRASSVIENLNSRLRNYFFLRKQVGPDYLKLLQFFLNHRRFTRSEHPHRVGKSPAELLRGQEHEHWLEMLGYQRFRRAA